MLKRFCKIVLNLLTNYGIQDMILVQYYRIAAGFLGKQL